VKLYGIMLTLFALTIGCGGTVKPVASKAKPRQRTRPRIEAAPVSAAAPKSGRGMKVTGITGSLNRGDVHQTIERYFESLLQCVALRPRRLGCAEGRIDFHFKIGPAGQVVEIHPSASTIGYRALELCLMDVVSHIVFPAPSGGDKTEFDWGMNVDPLVGQTTVQIEPEDFDKFVAEYAAQTYETCEIRKKTRFEVTAYIGRQGNVLAAGAIPSDRNAFEKLNCLLEEIAGWKLSRFKQRSKVTFTLKWQPPPPKKAKRHAKKTRVSTARGR
jgi:hypothetical protein